MSKVIKLRKGLNLNLKGKAPLQKMNTPKCKDYGFAPDDFWGMKPKVVVREGDHVRAGDALFTDKNCPEVAVPSAVSGTVTAIVRGERRKVLSVNIAADDTCEYVNYGSMDVATLDGETVIKHLLKAGLFSFINRMPYSVVADPNVLPRAVFVSALRDMPLAADFEYELEGNEAAFQTGLTSLSKIAKTYLGIGVNQTAEALVNARDVETAIFDGPCPAGNVCVQINHIAPINKGETVWTVDPTAVIFIGRLFETGKVDLRRTIAVAGSKIKTPTYVEAVVGMQLSAILKDNIDETTHVRIINGNPLTGKKTTIDGYLGAHTSEVTAIPEGDEKAELLGWIMPRTHEFSTSHSYFSWLFGKRRQYDLDARIKGGERHIIMSGEYDKVFPMDIYPEYLIKAIIAGDIDKMEQLGIYEVSPEDFALAEFVDSSKLELQSIVRNGLDMLRKETE